MHTTPPRHASYLGAFVLGFVCALVLATFFRGETIPAVQTPVHLSGIRSEHSTPLPVADSVN